MRDFLYCLVFPHPSNNHRAHLLQSKFLLILISLFFASALFFSSPGDLKSFADISSQELLNFTNQKRKESGLQGFSSNPALSVAAMKKAEDMFAKNYWAHNSPDGLTPWFFIKQAGYNYVYAGENLARGFNSSTDVVNAWMGSPDHRANLLSSNFKEVGFAVKSGTLNGESTFLVVQELGSRSFIPSKNPPTKKTRATSPRKVLGFSFSPPPSRINLGVLPAATIFVILLFIMLLTVDAIIIYRKKIVRVIGHNLDHALYLSIIVVIILIFRFPSIL